MRHARGHTGGFTLVEMIIVIAIVSLMAAVAIPTLARMGAFTRDDVTKAANEVYRTLQAAKMYAATFRVNTAVYYTFREVDDSRDAIGDKATIADGVGMARKLSLKEAADLFGNPELARGDAEYLSAYAMVGSDAGEWTKLPENGAIWGALEEISNPDIDMNDFLLAGQDDVLDGITIYDLSRTDADDRRQPLLVTKAYDGGFPAHVFKPSGELEAEAGAPVAVIYVGPSPVADVRDRFVDYDEATPKDSLAAHRIEISAASGRMESYDVGIVSSEP